MIETKDYYSVKLVTPMLSLKSIRSWLVLNCGRRWYATNYKQQRLNWRSISRKTSKVNSPAATHLFANLDYTVLFHFQKRDDMMLFLLVWPGEVLIKS
jgi:hypothetical protein